MNSAKHCLNTLLTLSLFTIFTSYSANANANTSYLQDSVLYILGTDGPDSIQISDDGNKWKIQADFDDGDFSEEVWFKKSKVDTIQVKGCSGDDQIQMGSLTIPALIFGNKGDDQIQGGEGPDTIYGGKGNDQIDGKEGNDTLFGGDGNDDVQGGNGNDIRNNNGPNDDGNSACTFEPLNSPPVADDANHDIDEDNIATIVLQASDANGDALTYHIVSPPQFGTLTGSGANLSYTPNANYNGTDTFTWQANDGQVNSNVATVSLIIVAQNDAPIASDQNISTNEDSVATGTVTATDIDSAKLTYQLQQQAENGTVTLQSNGQFSYTPNTNYNSNDSFTFIANDGETNSNVATVSITINAINDVPIANNQSISTNEDTAINITLTASDIDSSTLNYTITQQPQQGVLTGTAPNLTYTPNENVNGSDTFTFVANDGVDNSNTATVSITVNAQNDAPVADNQNINTDEDITANITLTASDHDSDTLTYIITQQPANGVLSGTAPEVSYTPHVDFNGNDSFAFIVNDGTVDSNEATISLTINSINDAPVADNQSINLQEDASIAMTLTGLDTENDSLTYSVTQQPINGTLNGTAPDLSYTPHANFNGTDSLEFVINDGTDNSNTATVEITIAAVNDAPTSNDQHISTDEDIAVNIQLTAIDVDGDILAYTVTQPPTNGILTGTVPTLIYTPHANFNGTDNIRFTANDGTQDSAEATIAITVNSINDAPIANNQSVNTPEDTTITLQLTGTDIENDALSYSITQPPTNGTLTGAAPNVTYTPNENYHGSDSFTFIANDGTDNSNTGTIDITIAAVNDEPTINITAPSGVLIFTDADTINFAANANDIEEGDISNQIEWTASPATALGTGAQINTTLAAGDYVIAAQITDSKGASVSDTITIQIVISNTAPVADNLTAQVESGQSVTIDLVAVDIDADPLTYQITTSPQNGSATLQNNQIIYTANASFTGQDRIEYVANDGTVDSNVADIIITVTQANEAPQITSQPNLQATEGALYEYQVTATDTNAGDTLTYNLSNAPAGATIDPQTGLIQWVPTAEQAGYNTDNNPHCLSSSESNLDQRFTDIVFVVDRSGSMGGETEFIQTLAPLLDANLIQNNIGAGTETNQFGLVMFGGAEIPLEMDDQGSLFTTSEKFYNATQSFRPDGGGSEDGWDAIVNQALLYPYRETTAKNIILVTDEHRANTNRDLTIEIVQTAIQDANVNLNVIVNANFECADGRTALGKGQNDIGYVPDGLGGFTTCQGVTVTGLDSDFNYLTEIHYIDLVLAVGGAAWDLNILRAGGVDAQSFVDALLDIQVENIETQLETQPQADIVIENLNYTNEQISLSIKNRGLVDIATPFTINLLDGTNVIATLTINSLAIGESQTVNHTYELTGSLGTAVNTTGINECSIENNQLVPIQFEVSVSDSHGLSQNQHFALTVNNINQAPQITSTAPTVAPINSEYRYQVEVNDLDKAEGLNYTLTQSPDGMRIDSVSGLITFKPATDQAGQYTVELNVTDINSLSDTQTYTITVDNSYLIPRFTSEPEIRAIQSEPYSYSPTVQSDATAQLTYTLLLAPNDMTVNAQTGEVNWSIPDTAPGEEYPLVLRVEDQFGNFDIQAYELIGDTPGQPPILNANFGAPKIGEEYETINVSYSDTNYNYQTNHQFNLIDAPAGASLETEVAIRFYGGFGTGPCQPSFTTGRVVCSLESYTRGRLKWTPDVSNPGTPVINSITSGVDDFCMSPINTSQNDFDAKQTSMTSLITGLSISGPLYDSNINGELDANDRQFIFGYNASSRRPVAIDAITKQTVWMSSERLKSGSRATLIDLEGDASAELILYDSSNFLFVLNNDGSLRWRSSVPAADGKVFTHAIPVDLNNDGLYEISFGPSVFDINGNLLWQFPLAATNGNNAAQSPALPIDFNVDGISEIAYFDQVRDSQGNVIWTIPVHSEQADSSRQINLAFANFDNDPNPELVVNESYYDSDLRTSKHWLMLIDQDGSVIWEKELPRTGAGQVSIADVDNDGDLEIYLAQNYELYDHNGDLVWQKERGSFVGVGFFADINGDGALEILENSAKGLAVIDALTGNRISIIFRRNVPTTNNAFYYADIDNDGDGEIVFVGRSSGFDVLENDAWTNAPSVYAYHQQSLGEITESLRLSTKANVFAQVSDKTPNSNPPSFSDITDSLNVDLAINFVISQYTGSNTEADEWQIRVKAINQGLVDAENVIVELYSDDPDNPANKFGEIPYPIIEAGKTADGSLTLNDDTVLGTEIFAKVVTTTPECNANNNIASAKTFNIQVTDSDGLFDRAKYLIGAVADRISVTSEAPTQATVGQLYQYQVEVEGFVNPELSYFISGAPGFEIDIKTGLVTWVPTLADAGRSYGLAVVVQDNILQSRVSGQQNFTVTVAPETNNPPQITSTAAIEGRVGQLYNYQVTATDVDGDNITYSLINNPPTGMSINGLSGLVTWTPDAAGTYSITLRATDERNARSEQTYNVDILDNLPPVISSTPISNAMVGIQYQYQIAVDDPDSTNFSYNLITAPVGMHVSSTGLLTWTPQTTQTESINLAVSDGFTTLQQNWDISVTDNLAPVINSSPNVVARINRNYHYQVQAADPEGQALAYEIINAPAGVTLSHDGLLSWSPTALGQQAFSLRVADGTNSLIQSWNVEIISDNELAFNIGVSESFVDEGDTVTITFAPFDVITPFTINATLDGQAITVDSNNQAIVTATGIGEHLIEATLIDPYDTLTASATYYVRDLSDTEPPVIEIISPALNSIVSAPVDIVATIQDTNLQSWQARIGKADIAATELPMIAEGTTNINNEVLGNFDPTLLENGLNKLVIDATDSNGQTTTISSTVIVEGNLKIGHFSFTIEDLNIPLAGLPIRVTRTYDSRRRLQDEDFGYGWSIDYQNIDIEESRAPGEGWNLNVYEEIISGGEDPVVIPNYCIEPAAGLVVTVKLPTGELEKFEPEASPRCQLIAPNNEVDITFKALDDTQSTLEPLEKFEGRRVGFQLLSRTDVTNFNPLNPNRYRLTTRAGYIYILNQHFGIETVTDPNGNTLTYSDNGIIHSSGKSVSFVRDTNNRIIQIIDPSDHTIDYGYSDIGDLIAVTERDGAVTTHRYYGFNCNTPFASEACHLLNDMTDPLGRKLVKNIYDNDGRLIAQEDAHGDRTEFNHDIDGRQSIVTDRNGHTTVMFYDDRGNITDQIDALSNTRSFSYDDNDNQLSQTDELGNISSAIYNENNDQLTQTDPLGNTISFTYNTRGQETIVTDARGNVFNNTYDSSANLESVEDPEGNITSNILNSDGLPTSVTDAEGNTTSYTYDSEGNKLTETDAEGSVTTWTYDDNNNILSETRTRTVSGSIINEVTNFVYDERNRVIETTDALGNVTQVEYDLAGQQLASIDALGRRTEMTYDVYGNLLQTTYPDGSTETHRYDAENNRLSTTDRLGRITTFEYDALNREVQVNYADGSSTQTEYDAAGRVIADIDERGNRTEHNYDAAGRRISTTDALGNTTSFTYDEDGNQINMTDANSSTTAYTYNSLDQRTQTTFDDTSTQAENYDALSRRTRMTDQAGQITNYTYDALGRLTTVTDALNQVTSYTYDEQGNKLTQTDASGKTTSWTYDALGRVLSRTLPLGQQESFAYDANSNLTQYTDFNGQVMVHTYDINDRLIQTDHADSRVETYRYDAIGNRTEATISDTEGTDEWAYSYDHRDRLIQETKPDGTVLNYTYDAAGNKLTMRYQASGASTTTTRYSYDKLNRLQSTTNHAGGITNYSYDAVGNRSEVQHSNGLSTEYSYDTLNRLTQINHKNGTSLVKQYDYTLHPTGRRTQISESDGRTTNYTYDALYRLTNESIADSTNGNYTAAYSYDATGNRTQSIINGITTAYAYDNNDRLTSQGSSTYTYDDNGNTLTETESGSTKTYTYNSQNELIQLEEGGNVTTYQYNPDGIRTAKTAGGVTTDFIVDHNRDYAQVIEEREGGTTSVQYTYGDDLISQDRSGVTNTYLYDGLGSVRALSDSTGALTDTYNYEAFGIELNRTGTTENSYLYTGEQFDVGLGHYYLRARYYDQSRGGFTKMDTFQGIQDDPRTLHKYLYTANDPANLVDPSGNIFTLGGLSASTNIRGKLGASSASSFSAFITQSVGAGLQISGRAATKLALKTLRQCIRKKNKCELGINILIAGYDNRDMLEHIRDAQKKGRPIILTYVKNKKGVRRNWYRNKGECALSRRLSVLHQCDEYPMYKTAENNGTTSTVSIRWVPRRQNEALGGHFSFLAKNMETRRDRFVVVTSESLPSIALPLGKKKKK